MFENPRILIRSVAPLVFTFVRASNLGNPAILVSAKSEEDIVKRLPELSSTTGIVEIELEGDTKPRAVASGIFKAPEIAA